MSRHLPARPSLEYLKKQAKELLARLREQNAGAQLADAQHALAQEYGFASWPRLKAHVESPHAFVGTWTADLSRSVQHPLNPYRSATLRFAVDANVVTIDDVVSDASGRVERTRNLVHADGQARRSERGYVTTARWLSERALEAVVTKDGRLEGRVMYEVSPDGATLTLTAGDQRSVFTRS
jgi:hypothetical protein